MPQDQNATMGSGLDKSFSQTQDQHNLPPGGAAAASSLPKPPAASNFSQPVKSAPVPASGTTSGASGPQPMRVNFTAQIPMSALGSFLPAAQQAYSRSQNPLLRGAMGLMQNPQLAGQLTNAGFGAWNQYQQYQQSPFMYGAKQWLQNPSNFSTVLGALSPIASPMLQTAGLPLLMGAYSYLKDPAYLHDLTGGKVPKLASDFMSGALSGGKAQPSPFAATFRPSPVTGYNLGTTPHGVSADQKANVLQSGLGAGGALSGMWAHGRKMPLLGNVLGSIADLDQLTNTSNRLAGRPITPVPEVAQDITERFNPVRWGEDLHRTMFDPRLGTGEAAMHSAFQVLDNPLIRIATNPVATGTAGLYLADNLFGVSNALHAATGGQYGTDPRGRNTMSIPSAFNIINQGPVVRNMKQPELPIVQRSTVSKPPPAKTMWPAASPTQ